MEKNGATASYVLGIKIKIKIIIIKIRPPRVGRVVVQGVPPDRLSLELWCATISGFFSI